MKMHIPAEKKQKILLKNALSCRKMPFPAEKCGFRVGTGQETAGNCRRVFGLKSQERYPTFTRPEKAEMQLPEKFL